MGLGLGLRLGLGTCSSKMSQPEKLEAMLGAARRTNSRT